MWRTWGALIGNEPRPWDATAGCYDVHRVLTKCCCKFRAQKNTYSPSSPFSHPSSFLLPLLSLTLFPFFSFFSFFSSISFSFLSRSFFSFLSFSFLSRPFLFFPFLSLSFLFFSFLFSFSLLSFPFLSFPHHILMRTNPRFRNTVKILIERKKEKYEWICLLLFFSLRFLNKELLIIVSNLLWCRIHNCRNFTMKNLQNYSK